MSKALKPIDEVRQSLQQMSAQFKMALPPHINVDKFIRTINTAIALSPKLLECDRTSLFAACMRAANIGLICDGIESTIIPFKGKCVWIPMFQGLLKLIRNSGELGMITSQVVHENDDFSYWIDETGPHLSHKPNMFGDRGRMIGVYALAKTKDGDCYVEVMTEQEIVKIKAISPSGNNGPWGSWEDQMWRKTVIKRITKYLPKSTDLENAIDVDTRNNKLLLNMNTDKYGIQEKDLKDDQEIAFEEIATAQVEQTKPDDLKPLPGPSITPVEAPIEPPKQAPKKKSFDSFLEGKNIDGNNV